MKIKQTTRILSPIMREVRDSLQNVCEIDKYELKDDVDAVVGWSIPKATITLDAYLKKLTVNGYVRVARSTAETGDFVFENFTYKLTEKSLLISIAVFESSYSITVN